MDEAVRARLAGLAVRYTPGRKALVRALRANTGPQSVADIHRRLRSIPLSSLYRSLALMEHAGVVSVRHGQGKVARYELAEWLAGHHHHFVCLQCGDIDDVELDAASEGRLRTLAEAAGGKVGYEVRGHRLELEGVCRTCQ